MNDFVARKLGEVLAFAETGLDTLERAKEAVQKIVKAEEYDDMVRSLQAQADQVKAVADKAGKLDPTEAKAQATNTKLRSMRDLYIGDEWDNPTEVYEWSGFYTGAAIVHWALVGGAAKTLNQTELVDQATSSRDFYQQWLEGIEQHLQSIGSERASE